MFFQLSRLFTIRNKLIFFIGLIAVGLALIATTYVGGLNRAQNALSVEKELSALAQSYSNSLVEYKNFDYLRESFLRTRSPEALATLQAAFAQTEASLLAIQAQELADPDAIATALKGLSVQLELLQDVSAIQSDLGLVTEYAVQYTEGEGIDTIDNLAVRISNVAGRLSTRILEEFEFDETVEIANLNAVFNNVRRAEANLTGLPIDDNWTSFSQLVSQFKSVGNEADLDPDFWSEIETEFAAYVVEMSAWWSKKQELDVAVQSLVDNSERQRTQIAGLAAQSQEAAHTASLGAADEASLAQTIMLAGVAGFSATILIMGISIIVSIVRPLSHITKQTDRLAEGDLDIELPNYHPKTEIGAITKSLLVFRENAKERLELQSEQEKLDLTSKQKLEHEAQATAQFIADLRRQFEKFGAGEFSIDLRPVQDLRFSNEVCGAVTELGDNLQSVLDEIHHMVSSMASGDLTVRVDDDRPGRFGEIAKALNSSANSISNVVSTLKVSIGNMDAAFAQFNQTASELSQQAEREAQTVKTTTDATSGVSTAAASNRDTAQDSLGISTQTAKSAEKSQKILKNTIAQMDALRDHSQKMASVTDQVGEMAFQTDLLALNASVEAARAGEAGRGFAVVAGEVRGLAIRSGEAAKDIQRQVEQAIAEIQSSVQMVNDLGDELGDMIGQTDLLHKSIEGITQSSDEQATTLLDIMGSLGTINEMTQNNAALAEQTSQSTDQFVEDIQKLTELADFFSAGASSGRSKAA
ncbi:methyl-accepting chemotaxis protein [Maritalea sp.]|uniref:methyl-accepting chemotaxis protein n=1 Tax=Maritalea sp. TaxID=2003361 RepID=UPI003EF54C29